jgi:hypothetical protein
MDMLPNLSMVIPLTVTGPDDFGLVAASKLQCQAFQRERENNPKKLKGLANGQQNTVIARRRMRSTQMTRLF